MPDAAFGSMWRKMCPWVFVMVLAGYVLALWGLVIHDWMTDPPEPRAVATVWTPPATNFDIVMTSNSAPVVKLSWKTSMTISPKAKVNSEEIWSGPSW